MIKVKALVEHSNGFGASFVKAAGVEYELPAPDAAGLILEEIVAAVPEKAEKPAKQGGEA